MQRIVGGNLDASCAKQVIKELEQVLCKQQLKMKNQFFYTLLKVPMAPSSPSLFYVMINRAKGERPLPEGFDPVANVDPFTLEHFPKKMVDSPHTIFLPSGVANAKKVLRIFFRKRRGHI